MKKMGRWKEKRDQMRNGRHIFSFIGIFPIFSSFLFHSLSISSPSISFLILFLLILFFSLFFFLFLLCLLPSFLCSWSREINATERKKGLGEFVQEGWRKAASVLPNCTSLSSLILIGNREKRKREKRRNENEKERGEELVQPEIYEKS